jgi:lipopolysaccharide export system protein LptA
MRISLSLLLSALFSTTLMATEPPPPIIIEADRLEISQLDGRSLYQGNVQLQQGEMLLQADTLEIRQREGQLQRVIANGKPAQLRIRDEQSGQLIRAEAAFMDYQLDLAQIEMKGDAVLWRGQDEFHGQYLLYNFEQRSVQASGRPNDTDNNGRVRIILQQEPQP